MPDLLSPIIINRHYGMQSDTEAESIGFGRYANLQNINCQSVGSISPDKGYTKHGNTSQSGTNVISCPDESYKLRDGSKVKLKVIDNGTNTILLWLNPQETTNHEDGEWEQLVGSLTTAKKMSFAQFNTTSVNRLYFSNGVENLSFWNGATTYLTAAASLSDATVTVKATTNFSSSGTFVVRGDDNTVYAVTYSGKTATTFTGCSGMPATSANRGVAEQADTSTLSSAPKLFGIKTINARIVGFINTRLYGSAIGDGTDWTVPGTVTISSPFVRDFPEGDGDITSLSSVRDTIIIGKPNRILAYRIEFTSSTTDPYEVIEELDGDYGPITDNFVKMGKSDIAYMTVEGELRVVTLTEDNEKITILPLSDDVRATLKNGDFTNCAGTWWRKNRVLLYTFKTTSDSTQNDRQIKIEFATDRENNFSARPQISFKNWQANCFSKDGSDLFMHGSYIVDSYQAFDGYTADGAPYLSIATTKRYELNGGVKEARVYYMPVIGYIAPGVVLKFELDYDNAGTRAHLEANFNSLTDTDYIVSPNIKTIGAFVIGTEPIGGPVENIEDLNFFKIFFLLPENHNPYDIQMTVYSDGADASGNPVGNRWKIIKFGFDIIDAKTQIDKKLKKNFTLT